MSNYCASNPAAAWYTVWEAANDDSNAWIPITHLGAQMDFLPHVFSLQCYRHGEWANGWEILVSISV